MLKVVVFPFKWIIRRFRGKPNTVKTLLLTLISFLALNSYAQNVYIPDANFKAYLVGNNLINTNGDTEIQVSEAVAFTGTITCGRGVRSNATSITDLTGIEAFTALTYLYCYNNKLTSLDVTQNTALTYLDCSTNKLTSLDVTQNTALTYLYCRENHQLSCVKGVPTDCSISGSTRCE